MRKIIPTILSLIAVLGVLTPAAHAQLVVWSTTNFVDDPIGPYGAIVDYAGGSSAALNIVTPGEGGGTNQALELTFDAASGTTLNFQTTSASYPASGNTNAFLANYTLSFDMQVTGDNVSPANGLQLSIFENQTAPSGYAVFGSDLLIPSTVTNVFIAGVGYQHYSFPLSSFRNTGLTVASATNFAIGIGYVAYPASFTDTPETIDIDNLEITMATNPPPPPQPTLNMLAAKPGLRIFAQASDATYTQEGIGTIDPNQSWVGVATKSQPVSYALTFQEFDTVANYTMNVQFAPGAASDSPYSVYEAANDLLWTITSQGGARGFITSVAFKTNSAANVNGGETNVVLAPITTTSTNGRGTWTLTFTSDTNGMVTAPDGTSGSFVLDPNAAAQFANPLTILFGTSAGATGGYGQFTDLGRLEITNVVDGSEFDDFTQDDVLNAALWDPGFSRDAGSVIQVSSNAPSYWVNWNIPDDGFELETKARLIGGTNAWFSPNYYGSGIGVTNTLPTLMGTTLKWTWIPNACLPTVDGTVGGTPSPTGLFRLSSPPPPQ